MVETHAESSMLAKAKQLAGAIESDLSISMN